jgi:hypothetical protein
LYDENDEIYKFYKRKLPYYESMMAALFDQTHVLTNKRVMIQDCPDHPANPLNENHDQNDHDYRPNQIGYQD